MDNSLPFSRKDMWKDKDNTFLKKDYQRKVNGQAGLHYAPSLTVYYDQLADLNNRPSFPHYLNNNLSVPSTIIKINKD